MIDDYVNKEDYNELKLKCSKLFSLYQLVDQENRDLKAEIRELQNILSNMTIKE